MVALLFGKYFIHQYHILLMYRLLRVLRYPFNYLI